MKTQSIIGITVVVILIIAVGAVIGFTLMPKSSSTTSTKSSSISSLSSSTTSPTSTSTTSQTSTSTTSSQQNSGTLAMGVTDPPITASGVSDAVVTYNGVAVHSKGAASNSGWAQLNATGTIDLMSSTNVSETIASAHIQSGVYDMARINITSGTVTYKNQNYAAAIAAGTISATMQQDATVNSTAASEAIIDLRTLVINSGNSSSPQFIISASAKATAEPPSAVVSSSLKVGTRTSLQGQAWWTAFVDQTSTKIVVSSATLTNTSLNLALKNSGNASADVQTVIITPVSAEANTTAALPASLSGSAVFTVSSSGSMQQSNTLEGAALLSSVGTTIIATSSSSLTYSGSISLGFDLSGILQISGIVSGQQYLVTCMGANTYTSIIVVAQ